jgi:YgiT-type zinc finger domain-containing protein
MEKTCSFCGNATVAPRLVEYIYRHRGEYMIVTDVPCEECTFCGERYFEAQTLRKIEQDFEQVCHGDKPPLTSVTVPVERYALI